MQAAHSLLIHDYTFKANGFLLPESKLTPIQSPVLQHDQPVGTGQSASKRLVCNLQKRASYRPLNAIKESDMVLAFKISPHQIFPKGENKNLTGISCSRYNTLKSYYTAFSVLISGMY